jgi:SNF2 family DNA or RNA helicase
MHIPVPLDVKVPLTGLTALPAHIQEMDDDALFNWVTADKTLLPQIRSALGVAKIAGTLEWIEEQFAQGLTKLVVFAWHTPVLTALHERLGPTVSVLLHGPTGSPERVRAVERFQNDPACKVFIGQIIAAGTAICLDAAQDVAMVEAHVVPGDNYQAYSRVINPAKPRPISVSWLYVPDSADERLQAVLRRKTAELHALFH